MNNIKFDFTGNKVAVIGASSGMGRETALELAYAGAEVLAIARNKLRLQELQSMYPEKIHIALLDVTKATNEDWENLLTEFVGHYGKLNGAVYTAGISGTTPLRLFDERLAREIMETSFWGAIKFLQILSKKKYTESASSFALFSSTAGCVGERGLAIYSAAKAALRMAVRSYAHDLSRNRHRVNVICPGYVRTAMTEKSIEDVGVPEHVIERHLLGLGTPQDVVGMVLFLLSDRAKWITGEDFIVDGGYLCGVYR